MVENSLYNFFLFLKSILVYQLNEDEFFLHSDTLFVQLHKKVNSQSIYIKMTKMILSVIGCHFVLQMTTGWHLYPVHIYKMTTG